MALPRLLEDFIAYGLHLPDDMPRLQRLFDGARLQQFFDGVRIEQEHILFKRQAENSGRPYDRVKTHFEAYVGGKFNGATLEQAQKKTGYQGTYHAFVVRELRNYIEDTEHMQAVFSM